MRVKPGRVVLLDYMVKVGTGQVVETSAAKGPIEYLHGSGQILPALERALEGLGEGEQAAFSIPAADAYGQRKDDNIVSLPRTLFPDDLKLEKGLCLYARASGGQSYPHHREGSAGRDGGGGPEPSPGRRAALLRGEDLRRAARREPGDLRRQGSGGRDGVAPVSKLEAHAQHDVWNQPEVPAVGRARRRRTRARGRARLID
jgi:hypothetical protein